MYSHIERRNRGASSLRLTRVLGWLFSAIALAMMALLAYQAGTFRSIVPEGLPSAASETAGNGAPAAPKEEITVTGSRFTGFDKRDQPFSISAQNAVQDENDASKVRLQSVDAEVRHKSGQQIAIKSNTAVYDAKSKTIDLQGDVRISSTDGFDARMAEAVVDINRHRLRSEVPVKVVHPRGVIQANGMEIEDDGARILFFNGVKARFGTESGKGSPQ
jgi:lipopolysaccharide export system protein LptC